MSVMDMDMDIITTTTTAMETAMETAFIYINISVRFQGAVHRRQRLQVLHPVPWVFEPCCLVGCWEVRDRMGGVKVSSSWDVIIRIMRLVYGEWKKKEGKKKKKKKKKESFCYYYYYRYCLLFVVCVCVCVVLTQTSLFFYFFFNINSGWTIIGKKDCCPYCKEKVDLKAFSRHAWDTTVSIYTPPPLFFSIDALPII
jgi:hypothetical protein